ncbi:IS6 family transposase [Sedimentitalea sp.]|uniref:IS6 family transposase n=1 Tax=Sedimentitalea sp. TaxID=2048915 RepID=UPI00329A2BD0
MCRVVWELLAERGIIVSHQTVRSWTEKFGRHFAADISRRSAGQFDGKPHLDEVVITMRGEKHWQWRAVDQDGFVLDVLVQSRRNRVAAKLPHAKISEAARAVPRVMILDKLRSYGAAKREIMPNIEHRSHNGLNNRSENSHQPTRQRERGMKKFKSPGHMRRSLSIHDPIVNLPHLPRHEMPSTDFREMRSIAMQTWRNIAQVEVA